MPPIGSRFRLSKVLKEEDFFKKEIQVDPLERCLDLIEILAEGSPEKSLTELSHLAGFNLTTTHRIINALQSRGYVRRNLSNTNFRLGFKLFEVGERVMRNLNLCEETFAVLKTLADKTELIGLMAELDFQCKGGLMSSYYQSKRDVEYEKS